MFYYLNGIIDEVLTNLIVIDCSGVGFQVNTSSYSISQVKPGEKIKLFTYVNIREDACDIYGFTTKNEKHCFELLLSVSGVGPKAALSILSVTTPDSFLVNIINENDKAISAAPGVGKKIAQRVILELKDKISKETELVSAPEFLTNNNTSFVGGTNIADASAALAVLGYSSSEINTVLKKIDVNSLPLESVIKEALRLMIK